MTTVPIEQLLSGLSDSQIKRIGTSVRRDLANTLESLTTEGAILELQKIAFQLQQEGDLTADERAFLELRYASLSQLPDTKRRVEERLREYERFKVVGRPQGFVLNRGS